MAKTYERIWLNRSSSRLLWRTMECSVVRAWPRSKRSPRPFAQPSGIAAELPLAVELHQAAHLAIGGGYWHALRPLHQRQSYPEHCKPLSMVPCANSTERMERAISGNKNGVATSNK